ncbi:MAG: hypothetical protein AB7P03_12325 [Kofleriaceae bacterium]
MSAIGEATSPPAPRRKLGLASIPAALLVVIAVWEIAATRCAATSVPDDAAWERAARAVRAGYRPGDLIVFAPEWVDPVGRLHLGDLIPLEMAARMDAARYGRIWELSIRGARSPDTRGLTPAASEHHDGVELRRYERPPAVVVADVRDRFGAARIEGGGRASLELAEVGFAPHRCIQVVPRPGAPTRVTFAQLPVGSELVGYVGIADVFTRRDLRIPGTLEVEIAGKIVASVSAGIDDGWLRFAVPTTPGTVDVTFIASVARLSPTKPQPDRLICFAAEARR